MFEAEQQIIAGLCWGGSNAEELLCRLTEDDFISDQAKDFFRISSEKFKRNGSFQFADILNSFGDEFDSVANSLRNKYFTLWNGYTANELINRLRDALARQKLINHGVSLQNMAARDDFEVEEILNIHSRNLTDIGSVDEGPVIGSSLLDGYVKTLIERNDRCGEIIGLETGYKALDRRYQGIKKNDYVVIAGRPSMGKTTLAQNIFDYNTIVKGKVGLFFSLETDADSLFDKTVASVGNIPLAQVQNADCAGNDYASQLTATISRMKQAKQFYDTRGGLTPGEIRAACYKVKREHGLDLVVIDYLQLMKSGKSSRYEQVTEISQAIKAMTKDIGCPFFVLSQLSREVEKRNDRRPIMADLRESGAIEQDADIIIFPYRDKQYDENSPFQNVAEIITAKFKKGRTGKDYLVFQGDQSAFRNCDMSAAEIERMIALAEHQQQGAKKTSAMSMG